jgi:hypothetical protein
MKLKKKSANAIYDELKCIQGIIAGKKKWTTIKVLS